ncbi:MAG: UDP-3-O-(3-hydroxymyristoyl)glucosamine N-acyltransferase [Candidatus Koribacter versatilis]|uniref:UDP-3-O-acylglucosamine N-acyltransferase n=1 Tax=Candidatus Korobacter versatilis TaxID=658062 RepID=A0A932A672_9BACT|nr:UDP-3-O-(3-hydroxymyristoyl)glucosamine N-acyltransferase [Candidatus Koribacter versatilis]
MSKTLAEIAKHTGARVVGDPNVRVESVASLHSAGPRDIVFVEDDVLLAAAVDSRAAAVIAGEFAGTSLVAKPLLVHKQPRLLFARVAALLRPDAKLTGGVNPKADVHPSAKLGKLVRIDARAVIEADAVIGDGSRVGAFAVIGQGVKLGKDCEIGPHVTVYSGTSLGDRVVVQAGTVLGSMGFGYVRDDATGRYEQFPQMGRLEIADDVEIGANCTVDRGALDATVIARGVKLDNMVHIGHNVRLGENVVIAAQSGVSGSSVIEHDVIVGGQVGIADHVTIETGAILGAQTGVPSKKIIRGKGVIFWGTPARPIKEHLRELAAMARLAKSSDKG